MEFIVGTALAGIPIVLEVYDRYWQLSEGLNTFRHSSRELTKLDTIMKTQKTLFRANVIKLLTSITNDREKARNLLSDSHSENLQRLKLPTIVDRARIESLQEMFGSWNDTLELVLNTATAICLEVESFGTSNTPKRFRLCWKKNEVQNSIQELRSFTTDFNELTSRITSELEQIRSTSLPAQGITMGQKRSHLNGLEKYRQIRSASSRLYNVFALQWSCAGHQRHAASISLIDKSKSMKLDQVEDGIKFDVAIDCGANSPTCRETTIWLEIEVTDGSRPATPLCKTEHIDTKPDNAWADVMEKITRHSQPMVIRQVEKAHKRVITKLVPTITDHVGSVAVMNDSNDIPNIQRTADDDRDEATHPASSSTTTNNASPSDSMIDLKMIENICCHFQVLEPTCSSTCVGYIQDVGLHLFYLPPPERRPLEQQKSLADIIAWTSKDELSRDLPRTAVAHIASCLAVAVLQYHSTPWLPDNWQSTQVHFSKFEEHSDNTDEISSTTPYFRVEFKKPDEGRFVTAMAASATPATSNSTANAPVNTSIALARNELLFCFGIVLLELGYCQLWPQLRQRVLATLPPQRNTDYHAAEKLAQTPLLRNRMGPRFIKIVRKCLGCDFGLGENDLANEQLQGVFLVDVVRELQGIERGLKELELHLGKG
ncbi:uncharacterized protein N7503_008704 [Penicillium pulvis]|uniref:uncharacterized protein n=1 Tax=Penicillium pulvis TaxID=1562058 RepID=UPI002548575A|nr:uncharacterized protein N7503_008704 [Penicillium pulvis]KAJ5792726.1 hypothetical protein N7503_008704 [Penicillium pulvis]